MLLLIQRDKSEFEHGAEHTRIRKRVKHQGEQRDESFSKFPHR